MCIRDSVECMISPSSNTKRLELLQAADVIVWDEFPSNHRELFEAVCRALNDLAGKVVVTFGDFAQIAPVVPRGSRLQIVQASIISSTKWQKFQIRELTKNMRLLGLHGNDQNLTVEQTTFLRNQEAYGKMISAIGRGTWRAPNYIGEDE